MTQTPRMRRLAGRIQEIVAVTLRDQVKDPRVGMITITAARITPDLRDATVFYTVLGDDADWAATSAALESAKGVLRSAVGEGTGVRFTPTLTFTPDQVPEVARHIDDRLPPRSMPEMRTLTEFLRFPKFLTLPTKRELNNVVCANIIWKLQRRAT